MRTGFILATALGLAAISAAPAWADVERCSRMEPSGERTLCHEAVVDAPLAEVWTFWTTSEGMRSWAAPVAAIDARPGGMFESSYDPEGRIGAPGNIQNRVVAIVPERLLSFQIARVPPGFEHAEEARRLATVVEFEAIDAAHTRVRVSMLGYGQGNGFDALYRFFDWGNGLTLEKLQQRAVSGPVDWRAQTRASQE